MNRRRFLNQAAGWTAVTTVAGAGLLSSARAAAPIVVGQSAALTGSQASFGLAMRDGIQAAIHLANRTGGVGGRPVQLVSLDDEGNESKTEANVAALVGNPRITGLTGFTTRPCSEIGATRAAKDGIALVGAFSGTPLLYGPKAATTFTTRASYEGELEAIVKHYRFLGVQRFGFLHLEDARATNVPLLESILAKQGGQLTVTAGVDRKGPGLNAAAMKKLESSMPEALIILANNAPLTPFLREFAPRSLVLPKIVISFVDREKLLADLGPLAAGVGFSIVVPENTRERYSVVRDFRAQAKELQLPVTPVSLEGFVTGLALVEGLRQAKSDSRTALIEGMSRISELDVGYTRLRYGKNARSGSHFVDLSLESREARLI